VELNPREFDLLRELMLNSGRVLTREQLEQRLYDWDGAVGSNTIEVFIHHLRRKLAPELIRTIRGVGYVMPREGGGGHDGSATGSRCAGHGAFVLVPCALRRGPSLCHDKCSMRIFRILRIGSAAPHRSWSPQVKAVT